MANGEFWTYSYGNNYSPKIMYCIGGKVRPLGESIEHVMRTEGLLMEEAAKRVHSITEHR